MQPHESKRITDISLLRRENSGVVIVDMQEKLMGAMGGKERVIDRAVKLIHLAEGFDLPIILTEQNPGGLGPTLSEIREHLPDYAPIEKMEFNCLRVEAFNKRLEEVRLHNIILMGVETHICIFQTCVALLERGYRVHIPHHAVDSRTTDNWRIGLELMRDAGAVITSAETIIFQLLKKAGTEEFKKMLPYVK
ncbi:MAG: hydrolase [Deltaproteobacteria bacterium]|nr:hydrolase [Deltaproteobacteria bacterium]MCF8119529.1 hydrolase [Deltaproteobacteria bacterium]